MVSVVVPVYNVEAYLNRCVDSLLEQTYRAIEIILIDDGSTDSSGEICDSYAAEYSCVTVVHQENQGLSMARNKGIEIAKGDWLVFIDSDDWVDTDYIEFLKNKADKYNADISICNPVYAYESGVYQKTVRNHEFEKVMDGKTALETMLYQNYFDTSAWCSLYKATLFTDVRYPRGRYYEDLGTTYKLMLASSCVVFSSDEKYYYFQRKTSIMASNEYTLDYAEFGEEIYNYCKVYHPDLLPAAAARFISACGATLIKISGSNAKAEQDRLKLYQMIRSVRKGILFKAGPRHKVKFIVTISYLPPSLFFSLFYFLKRFNKRKIK